MKKKFKELYFKWLIPFDYEFRFLIDDLNVYEDNYLERVFNIPFDKTDNETKILFYINGIEIPENNTEIEFILNYGITK